MFVFRWIEKRTQKDHRGEKPYLTPRILLELVRLPAGRYALFLDFYFISGVDVHFWLDPKMHKKDRGFEETA